jgi:benzoyl-CoA reductase/2-hydroxyglutaryl-CoA dehydratase subunit BcrC/BadD/HgdB
MKATMTDCDARSFAALVAQRLDDPLCAARLAAGAGQRVIGYVSADAPVELIFAAGALPVRLRGTCTGFTPRADEYLESAFVPELRAVAEQWLSGALDFIAAVVFPRSHDSAQRLYYYLCELQRRGLCAGPTPLLFDVANISRESSFEHTLVSTRLLARRLGATDAGLAQAVTRVAHREALLQRLTALQLAERPLTGSAAQRALRAAEHDYSDGFEHALARWLDQVPRSAPGARLLLAGSAPPDDRLHRAVEAAGATIVRDCTETERASIPAADGGDSLTSIASRHHLGRSPAQHMLGSRTWLVEQARAARADGVLLWLIEEDEALPWEAAAQAAALHGAGIRALTLTRQRWLAEPSVLDTLADFVRALERAP